MRRIFNTYFVTFFLFIFFVACNSSNEPAAAKPRFHDEPKKFGTVSLSYVDTTSPQFLHMIERLDSFYRRQTAGGFNGSVLIGYKGKILYERYFGFANREQGQRIMPTSSGQLASTSKTFTASAILLLHQHKYLNINEEVKAYLPSFPYDGITIKMLLNHRSGLPNYLNWVPRIKKDTRTPMTNDELLQLYATHKPKLDFKPDTRFNYSNTNYAFLSSIIESVTEMSYSAFMKKYIFDPLGLDNTFVFDPAEGLPQNATISYKYNWVREPVMYADGITGDKGIYSTARDLYRWDQSLYKGTILNNESIELAYGPCSFERPGVKNYGLGWRMFCYPDGDKIIYHNGWWHGNNTVFYRFIKDNFTIIVLGNKYNSGIYRQAKPVFSIVNNSDPKAGFDADE